MLLNCPAVAARTNKVFPVVTDEAKLPYILYRRASMEQIPVKSAAGADTVRIEVLCFTEKYAEGVELAEAVRSALDQQQAETDGLRIRSCTYIDGEESWQDDAYVQELDFSVKL
jgi:hypothetical protein